MASERDPMLELSCKKIGKSKMVNVYAWPAGADSDSWGKRSDVVHTIIQHQRADLLERITKLGWEADELLIQPQFEDGQSRCRCRNDATSALRECTWNRWSEGVKLCLDAGADSNFNPESWNNPRNPLELAVLREKPDMVKYLLEKGADPNIISKADRGLTVATSIINCIDHGYDTQITQLLFEHGSDVDAKDAMHDVISGLVLSIDWLGRRTENMEDNDERQRHINNEMIKLKKGSAALLALIVKYGPDVTKWNADNNDDILYELVNRQFYNSDMQRRGIFYQEHFELIYRYGGYTDEEHILEEADTVNHTNTMRWLIRHGADTTALKPSMIAEYMYPEIPDDIRFERSNEIPLVLVQSGLRLPENVRSFLVEIDKLIEKPFCLSNDNADDLYEEICLHFKSFLDHHKDEEYNSTKTIPSIEQRLHQMADLEEFSDASLHAYPESHCYIDLNKDPRDILRNMSSVLVKVLDFVSQPLSLQWWCRHYLRDSLVSLHPSTVKTLLVPAKMKRYILCHEL